MSRTKSVFFKWFAVSCRCFACWLLASSVRPCCADVLYFSNDAPPVSGRLVEENANGVQFEVRHISGVTTRESFANKDVLRVIRTVTMESLPKLENGTPSELLAHAETLLAIHHDLEAQHDGHAILVKLLERENLDETWRRAIFRLRLYALPPGLARERLKQEILSFGWAAESMNSAGDEREPWSWFVNRLSAETKSEWKLAMREDRTKSTDANQEQARVPRDTLAQRIRKTQAKLVVGDPVQVWMSELLAALSSDDVAALATLARLEVVLAESTTIPNP